MFEVKVPSPGESITEVEVGTWMKADGEFVNKDDELLEIESDKATLTVSAEESGQLKIVVAEGETVEVGAIVCTIDSAATGGAQAAPAKPESAPATPQAQAAPAPAASTPAKPDQIFEIVVPSPGESITEVEVGGWVKADGDFVEKDEAILEIESDKATLSIVAEISGTLRILVAEGESAEVGHVIGKIEGGASSHTSSTTLGTPAAQANRGVIKIHVPSPGESIAEVQIGSWMKKDGDLVQKEEELVEIESDKATLSITAEAAGKLKISFAEGETVQVGDVLCSIDTSVAVSVQPTAQVASSAPAAQVPAPKAPPAPKASPKSKPAPVVPQGGISRNIERKRMSAMRRKIAERLVAVTSDTAMLTTFNEVDLSKLMETRKKYKELFREEHDVGLGLMSFFTKAATEALKAYPDVNAIIDGGEILYHNYMDVSIAVSTPKGLLVPVIRNAENLSLAQIEREIARLAVRARDGKIGMEEMSGGTFTITNGGVFGSLLATPIINPPQSAILGMHKIEQRPIALNGEVVIRPMMYIALSYDHRIIDGKESVSFLVKVKEYLEDPIRLLLGV